ncbi:hypothetical protein B0T21DRAFT_286976, partial [Apiosordaria backusii]
KMQLRPAANEPGSHPNYSPATAQQPSIVDFLHPGYPEGEAVLLSLPALDDGGIDFDTALAACGLIAGNRWSDGFFSLERGGAVSVERPDDGILREPQYFFHLPGPLDPPYPIVPRFSHWRFPHNNLPPLWQKWAANAAATQRIGGNVPRCCILSNYGDGLEMAHLLPTREDDWWLLNNMQRYSRTQQFSSNPIDGPANLVTLRADLHRVFDERHFCFVPKRKPPQLVVHVFNSTPTGQLPILWHNRALHPIPATVAVQCLFTRFAWTVLSPSIFDEFLPSSSMPRRLLLWSPEERKWKTEEASPEMCRQMWTNARSRSPKKRSAARSADAADEILAMESRSLHDSGYFGRDTFENDGYYDDDLGPAEQDEEEHRGRSRKRRRRTEEEQDLFQK